MKATAIVMSALGWLVSLSPVDVQASVPDLSTVLANDDAVSRLRELAPYIQSLRPEEVPAALKRAIAGHGPGRDDAINALSGRWAELDSPAALTFARQTSDREAKESIEDAYYGAWAERDPDGALEAANRADAGERAEAIWQIANKIGARDPQRAHELISSVHASKMTSISAALRVAVNPTLATKVDQLDKILWESNFWLELEALLPFVDGLTSTEFPQALDRLRNTPDSTSNAVIDVLIERWSKVDPSGMIKAIPVALTIHDVEFSDRFLADVYSAWAQRDPEAAFASATRDNHGVGNFNVLRALFAALARQDPPKAYAAFKKLNNANSHLLVVPIFTEWGARDIPAATKALQNEGHWEGAIEGIVIGLMRKGPTAAINWTEHLPNQHYHDRALQDVALRWPDDPEAAAAWLEKGPPFDGKDSAFGDVAVDWAIRDSMEALHHATTLPDGKEKDALLYWGLAQLTYDDAVAAQLFARQLPGDEMKKHALATVLAFWSEYDPAAAANFLASIATEATPSDVAGIADSLSHGDPLAAVHWLDSLPATVDKAPATSDIAKNWYRLDSSAAGQWVNKQPAGPLYDAGAQGICAALQGNRSSALKWARSIRDPKIRHDAVYHAFEAATSYRLMDFGNTDGIKDEIHGALELSDADKTKLIARIPVLKMIEEPQPVKKSQIPADR